MDIYTAQLVTGTQRTADQMRVDQGIVHGLTLALHAMDEAFQELNS